MKSNNKHRNIRTRTSKLVRIFKCYGTDANANDAMQMCKKGSKRFQCWADGRALNRASTAQKHTRLRSMFRLEIVMCHKNEATVQESEQKQNKATAPKRKTKRTKKKKKHLLISMLKGTHI